MAAVRAEQELVEVEQVARRRQLVDMRAQEKNRLSMVGTWQKASIQEHIAWLDERITDLDDYLVPHLNGIKYSELKEQKLWDKY